MCLCFWVKAGLAGGGVIRGTFSERLSLGPTWLFGCGSKLPWPSDSRVNWLRLSERKEAIT